MNSYFIDTSALFKRYINEPGTAKLDEIFVQPAYFYISDLTIVELISNLQRLNQVEKMIGAESFIAIKAQFFGDIAGKILCVEPVTPQIITTAVDLIKETYITPVDSIQLATAIILRQKCEEVIFLCSDRKLLSLAVDKGFVTQKI